MTTITSLQQRNRTQDRTARKSLLGVESLEERRVLTAMLQVIHNSPYEASAIVDVYVNDEILLDDFAFRDATPFVEVPSGVDLEIDITAPDAADSSSPVYSVTVNLEDMNYVAMAAGDPASGEGQPQFGLALSNLGRTVAENVENAEFYVVHGSPDAPTVDIVARDVGTLVDDVSFPNFADDYISVPPANYTIDITPGESQDIVVSYEADLSGAAGGALVVAASGFLTPKSESDPGFGLLAVFADGTTALLPAAEAPSARLQVIHNSPFAAASSVDVYANGSLLLDNFEFRDASPFVDVPSGVDITLDITAADASDNSSPVFSATVNLESKTYIAMAAGDPLGTEGQPAFGLAVTDIGQESSVNTDNVEFLVVHGSPDAPAVNVAARGIGTLIEGLSYPDFDSDYISVGAGIYTIDVAAAADPGHVLASFEADLTAATGASIVVSASGFLAPRTETDPSFGLLAVFADGSTAMLPATDLPPVPGDSNGDGQFDHKDLTLVFQAAKYEKNESATFAEGDWNGDGLFDTHDFVHVFQFGKYVNNMHEAAAVAAVDAIFESDEMMAHDRQKNRDGLATVI